MRFFIIFCLVVFVNSNFVIEHSFDNGENWLIKGTIEKIGRIERLKFVSKEKTFWTKENFSKLVLNKFYQIRVKDKDGNFVQTTTSTVIKKFKNFFYFFFSVMF